MADEKKIEVKEEGEHHHHGGEECCGGGHGCGCCGCCGCGGHGHRRGKFWWGVLAGALLFAALSGLCHWKWCGACGHGKTNGHGGYHHGAMMHDCCPPQAPSASDAPAPKK